MSDVIDRFCTEHHAYNDISADRRVMQRRVLTDLADSAGGPLEAGAQELHAFLASRLESGLSPATVTRELSAIRPFFRWAWRAKLLTAQQLMEVEDVKPPRGANRSGTPRPYSRKELQQFWTELDEQFPLEEYKYVERWQRGTSPWKRVERHFKRKQLDAIVVLALYGGLRRDEIWRLAMPDMHPENSVVAVRCARKNPEAEERNRAVPLLNPMYVAIVEWFELRAMLEPATEQPWLSLHRQHRAKAMQRSRYRTLLHDVGSGWSFHRFRHTAATEMLRARMPLEKVQAIMGHSRPQQTLAYTQLLTGDLVDAALRAEDKLVRAIERTRE